MKRVPDAVRKELMVLAGRSEDDIDFSDLPPTATADWAHAVRGQFYKPIKKQLTVRIDADVLEWLKSEGKEGYQKRLNAILRMAMLQSGSASAAKHP